MADWMDDEVEIKQQTLNNGQIFALLRMTEAIRSPAVARAINVIKTSIDIYVNCGRGDLWSAKEAWEEMTESEQTALWVAPKFGGIFTTEERKIIKGGFEE